MTALPTTPAPAKPIISQTNPEPTPDRKREWRNKWSIAIYTGPSPLTLGPVHKRNRPVLTTEDVTDIACSTVADPFFLRLQESWYLFFEVFNQDAGRGEIAYATSPDGLAWQYQQVVLREPFHLSYPHVFAWDGAIYMIPETRQAEAVRLYRADDFPHRWRYVDTLLRGRFADATLLHHQDRWWLFAQRGLDEMRLFTSETFTGNWREHPANPLWPGNRRCTRPGGRILTHEDRLLRFAQDGWPTYGRCLRAFEIDRLTEREYAEHELPESPILEASGTRWNAMGMHHLDAVQLADGSWLAAVDGASLGLY